MATGNIRFVANIPHYVDTAGRNNQLDFPIHFNVKGDRFNGGAKGDGVTDDTAAIQAAFDAAAAVAGSNTAGAMVYLPPGGYLISSGLTVTKGITLRGAGRNRTLIVYSGTNAISLLKASSAVAGAPNSGMVIEDIGFLTTAASNVSVKMLHLQDCAYFTAARISCSSRGPTPASFQNKTTGILVESTQACVPPVGNGNLTDILVNSDDSGHAPAVTGSRGIHILGVNTSTITVQEVTICGHGNLENCEDGVRMENAVGCSLDGTYFIQGNANNVHLTNAQNCLVSGGAHLNRGTAGISSYNLLVDGGSVFNRGGHIIHEGALGAGNESIADVGWTSPYGAGDSTSPATVLRCVQIGGENASYPAGTKIRGHLSATTTWDPANVANGAQTTTTVAVTGALLGDEATACFSLSLQGMQLTAYVSASDTVTVVLRNGTGGGIDLGSGTLRASTWRH